MLRIDINILFTVINLLILVAALRIFLFKPVHKILDERQRLVDQSLADAAAARESAASLELQRQTSIAGLQEEKESLMREARSSAAAEKTKLLSEAKAESEKIVTDAQAEATRRKKELLAQAQSELSEIIVTAASKIVMQPQDTVGGGRLYDVFLEKTRDDHE